MEYGRVYDLKIASEDYRGIYLGIRISRVRPKSRHVILVNKSSNRLSLYSYSLISFKDCRFDENNKLILQKMHYIKSASNHREYLEDLLKKIK